MGPQDNELLTPEFNDSGAVGQAVLTQLAAHVHKSNPRIKTQDSSETFNLPSCMNSTAEQHSKGGSPANSQVLRGAAMLTPAAAGSKAAPTPVRWLRLTGRA